MPRDDPHRSADDAGVAEIAQRTCQRVVRASTGELHLPRGVIDVSAKLVTRRLLFGERAAHRPADFVKVAVGGIHRLSAAGSST